MYTNYIYPFTGFCVLLRHFFNRNNGFPFLFSFLRHYHLESQKSRKLSGLWILFSFKCVLSESDTKMQSSAQSLLFFFFFFFWDRMPPRRETNPPGIISEIFCVVLSALIPRDVSFFFLLARRCGLCYASAKPNRPRNGGVCQNTQRKMFWKGTSHKVGTRSYGKTWSGGPQNCRESPCLCEKRLWRSFLFRVSYSNCLLLLQMQKKTQ